jgi:hypothetical protein
MLGTLKQHFKLKTLLLASKVFNVAYEHCYFPQTLLSG